MPGLQGRRLHLRPAGKIAAGSGWHKFSLNVLNNSKSTLNELGFFAGASSDKAGDDLFQSKKVQLQAYDEDTKAWEAVDSEGYAVGYVGYTDELKPDYEVDIPLRINVKSSAPVGAGSSLGASVPGDADGSCTGFGEVAYKFQIVSAGTDTNGTKPQEGGQVAGLGQAAEQGQHPGGQRQPRRDRLQLRPADHRPRRRSRRRRRCRCGVRGRSPRVGQRRRVSGRCGPVGTERPTAQEETALGGGCVLL